MGLYPKESIIIFNEIQQFPKARQAIKCLVADGWFDYIETGSLISIKENVNDITIPSEERTLLMYPMNFAFFSIAFTLNVCKTRIGLTLWWTVYAMLKSLQTIFDYYEYSHQKNGCVD